MMKSKHYIATPPGVTIKEMLSDRGMTQKEFAERMGMSEKHISKLINGEAQLTIKTANKLEMVLGAPAHFWNNLEAIYREKLEKVNEENSMEAEAEIAQLFPYNEMVANKWVSPARSVREKIIELRKFFEITNLKMLNNEALLPKIAYRRLGNSKKAIYASYALAQAARIQARNYTTSPLNHKRIKDSIPQIREMTTTPPEDFCNRLTDILASCGIAIIFLPHLKNSYLHGATFIDNSKVVLGITVRGKDADRFWFSLFHELGHIVLGHLETDNITDAEEDAADLFARECLIPSEQFDKFVSSGRIDKKTIMQFADDIGIDAGIIVGRLQTEKRISFKSFNDLKTKYEFVL